MTTSSRRKGGFLATPSASRSQASRKAQASGASWEKWLDALHRNYRRRKVAVIYRSPPGIHIERNRGGRITGRLTGKGPPDYTGTLTGGHAIGFDAKSTRQTRWTLDNIKDHQAADLDAWEEAGAIGGIMLRFTSGGRSVMAWLPWEALGPLWWRWKRGEAARGEASLTLTDISSIGITFGQSGWLEAVRSTLEDRAA